jgi:hypothetical protein
MDQSKTPTLDPTIYDRNLAALRNAEPRLAEVLAHLPEVGPEEVAPAYTRDGRLSFRLLGPDGVPTWFGRTSIPTVRAEALLDRFDTGKANVILPGIGQGTEAALLTRRLGRHRAVFVWEPDARSVQLALRLHNLATAIEDGRLVLLVCMLPELTAALAGWLKEHPGHLCPNQMLMWPWQSMAEIAPIRSAVEIAYQRTEHDRQQALAQLRACRETIARTSVQGPPPARSGGESPPPDRRDHRPVIALVALHAADNTWALTDALSDAASTLGWPVVRADIRRPGDMHSLARASRLAGSAPGTPNLAILIDVVREQVRDILPERIPAICWLSDKADRFGHPGHDMLAVTGPEVARRALAAGADARRLLVCPPPCLASPLTSPDQEQTNRPIDLLLVSNTGPVDAVNLAPKLPSYAQIWKVAADLLAARIESFTSDQAKTILERAEAKLAVHVDDPDTRQEMIHLLGQVLAPSLLIRFISHVLIENNVTFRIAGPGWATTFPQQAGPTVSGVQQRMTTFRQTKVVIHADCTGLSTADALLAAGCGAAVIARRHPDDTQPGGLYTLLNPDTELLVFASTRELVAQAKGLLQDPIRYREMADRAVRRCLAEHAPAARLQALKTAATSVF